MKAKLLNTEKIIGVVGTRNVTDYGKILISLGNGVTITSNSKTIVFPWRSLTIDRFDISLKERDNYDQESYLPRRGYRTGDPSE